MNRFFLEDALSFGTNIVFTVYPGEDREEEITSYDIGGECPDEEVPYRVEGFVCPHCGEVVYLEEGEDFFCPYCENEI